MKFIKTVLLSILGLVALLAIIWGAFALVENFSTKSFNLEYRNNLHDPEVRGAEAAKLWAYIIGTLMIFLIIVVINDIRKRVHDSSTFRKRIKLLREEAKVARAKKWAKEDLEDA